MKWKEKSVIRLIVLFLISVFPEGIRNTKEFNNTSSIDVLPSIKSNLEYVKPLKISQNQYEDPRKCLKYINKVFNVCMDVYVFKIIKICIKKRFVYKSTYIKI